MNYSKLMRKTRASDSGELRTIRRIVAVILQSFNLICLDLYNRNEYIIFSYKTVFQVISFVTVHDIQMVTEGNFENLFLT